MMKFCLCSAKKVANLKKRSWVNLRAPVKQAAVINIEFPKMVPKKLEHHASGFHAKETNSHFSTYRKVATFLRVMEQTYNMIKDF